MKTTTEYEELKAAGLSDHNIMMLRNIGASHRSILEFAKKLAEDKSKPAEREPDEGQIVGVDGGIAQYRNGVFYTGMEEPKFTRPIQWEVKWWKPATICDCGHLHSEHHTVWAYGLECFACSICGCPEYSGPTPESDSTASTTQRNPNLDELPKVR